MIAFSKRGVIMKILVINGPNLNFLGIREPGVYGTMTYDALLERLQEKAQKLEVELFTYQSNVEGELINRIQQAYHERVDGIIINPGAYTHYSYALRDALSSISVPILEVHISNVHKREEFRHVSVTAPVCTGQIVGLGFLGYELAMEAIVSMKSE